jgi:hypothetical protein
LHVSRVAEGVPEAASNEDSQPLSAAADSDAPATDAAPAAAV